MKKILLGAGSRLRQDDAAGSLLAEEFKDSEWLSIDGSTVPENYFSIIKKNRPELLVIVDACEMKLPPGSVRRIPVDNISSWSAFNTHSLSLSRFLSFLGEVSDKIIFIGIQPLETGIGEGISPQVRESLEIVKKVLSEQKLESLERL